MIKRILVGLGGTPFTTVAVRRAAELAGVHRAQLTGVTVVDRSGLESVGPVPPGAASYAQRMRETRERVTREAVEKAIAAFQELCVARQVAYRCIAYEEGDPFAAMIREARYSDLTIFGLRSMFEYAFSSDPDQAIVRLLSQGVRPILAVNDRYRPVKNALIAYSGSVESARAMRNFLQLNPWPGVRLRIVHFREEAGNGSALMSDAADYCRAHGVDARTDSLDGRAISDLLPFAREVEADLIVLGSGVRSALIRKLLGDTVLAAVKAADRPLFLS